MGIPEFLDSERKYWTLDSARWTLDAGPWTLDSGLWSLDAELWTLDAGRWTLDSRRWTPNAGLLTLDPGRWNLDAGCWTVDVGRWMLYATFWTLGSGHWTLSLTVLEQNQKPGSDSVWLNYWKFFGYKSLKSSWSRLFCRDYSEVTIFRNSTLKFFRSATL